MRTPPIFDRIEAVPAVERGGVSLPLVTFVASTRHLTVRCAERPASYVLVTRPSYP